MAEMNLLWLTVFCGDLLLSVTFSANVERIYIGGNQTAVKGADIKLVCEISQFTSNDKVNLFNTDDRVLSGSLPRTLSTCVASRCFTTSIGRYSFSADNSHVYINITNLNQSEDQKWWTCVIDPQRKDMKLTVHIPVTTVTLTDGNSVPSDPLQVTSGVTKTLTCTASFSEPTATVVWYIGTEEKQRSNSSTSFTFTPQNRDHNKQIYCKAFNIQPESQAVSSETITLFVRVLATTPTLTNKTTSSLVLLENDTVKIECITSPTRPVAIVTWRKGSAALTNVHNTIISVDANLVSVRSVVMFTPSRTDDRENVYCGTSIPGQQNKPSSQQRITVYWPPSLPVIPVTDFPFLENQTGKTLSCSSIDYGNPSSEASWDSRYGRLDSSNSRNLQLPRLTPEMDKSQVTCQLGNYFTQAKGLQVTSPTISLDVEYIPRVHILEHGNIVQIVTRNEGQALSISCHAYGNPLPTVRWERQTPVSSELKFTDTDRTDHGIYTCRAEATSSKYPTNNFVMEMNVSVVIYYAPEVSVTFNDTQPVENTSLLITCNAVGRSNLSTSKSMKQTWGSLTIHNTHRISDGVFKIEKLQLQDSGTYICTANNGIPDRNQQIDQTGKQGLKVKVLPKVLLEESHIFAGAPGKSVNLSVPFYSYPGIRSVMFKFPNGSEIVKSVKYDVSYVRSKVTATFYGQQVELEGYIATLRISDEEESDFVNYTLVLDNGIGKPKEWTLFHVSESLPLVPKLFVFTSLVHGVPTFLLIGNFNGGRRQTFVIETNVLGNEEWKEQLRFSETDTEYLQKEKLTFRFNITGLSPNTYEVRVITRNVLGSIKDDDAPKLTFSITDSPTANTEKSYALVATGTTLGISLAAVLIYAVTITFLWWRRRSAARGVPSRDQQTTYVNLMFKQGVMGSPEPRCGDNATGNEGYDGQTESQYTTLKRKPEDDKITYEELQSLGIKTRKT